MRCRPRPRSTARRLIALAGLLLSAVATQAATYTFPGSLPAGCSGSNGSYSCPSGLTLASGDKIQIAAPKPATITITGSLTTNLGATVGNASPSDLTLIVSGSLNIGSLSVVTANISARSVTVNSNGSSFTAVNGNITSTGSGASGSVTIGQNSAVSGNIASTGANVTLNFGSQVTGSITTAGAIVIGQNATVTGAVTGSTGSIQLNNSASVGGTITTTSGAINLGQYAVASACVKAGTTGTITLNNQASANSVCCGASCTTSCVSNNSGHAMPPKCPSSASVDHYELGLPSSSLACLASAVTITACADASSPCTKAATTISGSTATLAASAGTLGATSVTFNGSGIASTTLSYGGAANGASATVTLSGESSSAANSRKCCPDGTSCTVQSSCSSTFSTAGFIVSASAGGGAATIPAQTAATASLGYTLRAVKTNATTQACQAAITGSTSVNWAYQCNNPTSCVGGNRMTLTGNSATTIAGNPATGVTTTTPVAMTFDANGNAPFSFRYSDVGQVTLVASKSASGSLLSPLSGATNAFVVKPAGFTLSAIRCTTYAAGSCATSAIASPGNNPGASAAGGTAFIPAGKPFSATVTAVDSLGNAVPNFGRENSPEGVALGVNLVQPVGGSAPALSNASAFGAFSGGAATGTGFAWGEAGIITLTPSVASGSYLGAGGVTGTPSGNVGRFIADHLTVAVTPGCSASFTYGGQPFGAQVTATNAAGIALANYGGSTFAKAVTLADAGALGVGSFTSGTAVAALAFSAGQASASPTYTFASKLTSPATLALRATDTDGASSAGYTEGSTALRSGRLRLSNGFGRETTSLQLTAQAEYWTGAGWLLNGGDSCTSVPAAAVALSNKLDNKGAATSAWNTTASAITIASGSGLLTLSPPSPTATGSIDIGLNLGTTSADQSCLASHPASTGAGSTWLRSQFGSCAASYDRDPSARATFGIFSPETRKTVHARELF